MRMNGNGSVSVWKQLKTNLKARTRLRRQQTAKARSLRLKYVSPDQLAYADMLDTGVAIGRLALAGMFIVYVLEFIAPKVPLSELPQYWSIPADQYSRMVGVGTGWSWLKLIGHGDYMNFLGIAFLASLTVACYVRILPSSFRRKDYSFSAILMSEVIILLLAASGLLAVAH
jgi:hypothetical protein